MNISYIGILFLALCTFPLRSGYTKSYTPEDLQVLSAENNYQEYLDHALDIEPSNRNAAWKTTTENMGLKYLASLVDQNKMPEGSEERIERISQWPLFRANEFFIKARDKYFLKKLAICIEISPTKCEAMGFKLLSNFEHEIIFPLEFLKITKTLILSRPKRLLIAAPLLKDKFSEFYCANSPLKELVLGTISEQLKTEFIIHKDCLVKLRSEIEEIALSGNSYALALLNRSDLMTPSFNQLIQIVSFFNIPELPKRKIDSAIKQLESISKSPNSRIKLMKEIKKLDPIPGRIFGKKDKASIGKLKIIERNFPEMIDFYAKTCLAYLKGTKTFVFGNPTPECHEFFELAEHLNTMPASYLNEYQAATKFMNRHKKTSP